MWTSKGPVYCGYGDHSGGADYKDAGRLWRPVRIAGHRVRVLDVVIWHELQGLTPDEIVSQVPSISLSDVLAALAYYYDHRAEIQEEIRLEREEAEEFQRNNPSLLDARLNSGKLKAS
jgi:uncharacterized protein (DUF433 family)